MVYVRQAKLRSRNCYRSPMDLLHWYSMMRLIVHGSGGGLVCSKTYWKVRGHFRNSSKEGWKKDANKGLKKGSRKGSGKGSRKGSGKHMLRRCSDSVRCSLHSCGHVFLHL